MSKIITTLWNSLHSSVNSQRQLIQESSVHSLSRGKMCYLNNAVSFLASPGAIFFYVYSCANNTTLKSSHYIFSISFRAQRVSKPDFALVVRKKTEIIKPAALVPVSRVNFYPRIGSSVPYPRLKSYIP